MTPQTLPWSTAAALFDVRDTPKWLQTVNQVFDTWGDTVRVSTPVLPLLATRDPDLMGRILRSELWDKRADLHKYHHLLMGEGLVTSPTNAAWRLRRKAVNPLFHARAVRAALPLILTEAEATVAPWSGGSTVQVHQAMRDFATRVNFAVFLQRDFEPWRQRIHEIMEVLGEPQSPLDLALPAWVPTQQMRRHRAILAELDAMIDEIVGRRRATGVLGEDYLGALLRLAEAAPRAQLTAQALRQEVITLLVAGHETTASAASWILYELAARPDLQDHLAEGLRLLPTPWTLEVLDTCLPLQQVIDEGLRLYPPVMVFIPRQAQRAHTLGDLHVAAHTVAFLFPWATGQNAALYPNPSAFDPGRAPVTAPGGEPAAMPFAQGPRKCSGERFANAELKVLLARVLSDFRLERVATVAPRMVNGALMPDGPLPLKVTPR